MRLALLLAILLAVGCAARPMPAVTAPQPPVDIDALVHRGCYRCLESAFEAATAIKSTEKAFEALVLLVARAKELGLPPGQWLERALTILPPGPDWAVYYDIVNTQQQDPLAGDREMLLAETFQRRRPRDVYDKWREALKAGPGSPILRAYLDLTIACRRDAVGRSEDAAARDSASAAVMQQFGDVPLLQYRAGLCGGVELARLSTVRAGDDEFLDADLELGRRALQNQIPPDVPEGIRRLESAKTAFPSSPIAATVIGNLRELLEEWPEALVEFDRVLALVPTHRDALLGRTVSLSNLDRNQEALATADRILELGDWFIGPAHYWSAWNLYQLERIQEARAAADRAKALMVNPALFLLSGMIEWREKRLDSAEEEFVRTIDMDATQCEGAFYLASVRWERQRWKESLTAFKQAGVCYEGAILTRRELIAELSATPQDATINASRIAGHERAIVQAGERQVQVAQNVAALEKVLEPTVAR
jgi:tetratricopeptide (TPR) repeat protein